MYQDKINELKAEINKRSNKVWTDDDVREACVAIIHSGVFKKGWNLNFKV